jgi:hypothetical protein
LGVAGYFAEVMRLETASIRAFQVLEHELRVLRAPFELVYAARIAHRDEVRHARAAGAVARQLGVVPRLPRVAAPRERDRAEIAVENAVEGCVRETFGAVLAAVQADRAGHEGARAFHASIAADEAAHAALAWALFAWLDESASEDERARVHQARSEAVRDLLAELTIEQDEPTRAALGLPAAPEAVAIAQSTFDSLLRAA